jgi:glutamyl-tRNA synthetase
LLDQAVRTTAEELEVGLGKIAQPLRVALTGTAVSPSIDKTLWLVGRERTLERVRKAIDFVQARAAASG